MGAPKWPPSPQTFAAPRRSRGAALLNVVRGPEMAPNPQCSERPGEAGALRDACFRPPGGWLLAGAGLEQELHLGGGGAPQREARLVIGVVDLLAELVHGLVLLVGRGHVEGLGPDEGGLAGGGVGPLDPAADLVPVLVEEDDDRNRLVAV